MLVIVPGFTDKWMGCLSFRNTLRKTEYLRQTEWPLKEKSATALDHLSHEKNFLK